MLATLPPPVLVDDEFDAALDRLIVALGAPAVLDPAATGRTVCHTCPHERKQHSRIGCLEEGCTCAVTYMDL